MKKNVLVLLAALALTLVGCGEDTDNTENATAGENVNNETAPAANETNADAPLDIVETALANGSFTKLAAALERANLIDTLKGEGPFTVFAPTDDAFDAAIEALGTDVEGLLSRDDLATILTYHVIGGAAIQSSALQPAQVVSTVANLSAIVTSDDQGVKINGGASVATPDVIASNGVIHVIDQVILPATILELAAAHPSFTTLVAAVEARPAVKDVLMGEGPFTLFAPTNEAFEAVIQSQNLADADALLALTNLDDILKYHAFGSQVLAAEVVAGDFPTLQGGMLNITVDGETVSVGAATVVDTDIIGTNGVIHVIDTVLLPSDG